MCIVVQKDMLKHALSRLPTPRNDYEIVIPDSESYADSSTVDDFIPDQADVEANQEAELRAKSKWNSHILIYVMCFSTWCFPLAGYMSFLAIWISIVSSMRNQNLKLNLLFSIYENKNKSY